MKLKLKHLAPYLPYGLKMTRNGFIGELKSIKSDGTITVSCSHWFENINDGNFYKPILRPLSDLTKEIEHNGEKLSPEKILSHLDLEWLITSDNLIMKTNYEDVLKLLEWHFDIFGLIDAGLAIDINQTNPDQGH